MYVENSLQNRFVFLISLLDLTAILKIRNGEHAHCVRLVVAYTWNREKQMFVALGKEFDMIARARRESAICNQLKVYKNLIYLICIGK